MGQATEPLGCPLIQEGALSFSPLLMLVSSTLWFASHTVSLWLWVSVSPVPPPMVWSSVAPPRPRPPCSMPSVLSLSLLSLSLLAHPSVSCSPLPGAATDCLCCCAPSVFVAISLSSLPIYSCGCLCRLCLSLSTSGPSVCPALLSRASVASLSCICPMFPLFSQDGLCHLLTRTHVVGTAGLSASGLSCCSGERLGLAQP